MQRLDSITGKHVFYRPLSLLWLHLSAGAILPFAALLLVFWAEMMSVYLDARYATIAHVLLLTLFLSAYALEQDNRRQAFFLAVAMAPLIRIISLSMPVQDAPLALWYLLTAAPILTAGVLAIRLLELSPSSIGLRLPRGRQMLVDLAVGLSGMALGYVEWHLLQPTSIVQRSALLWLVAGTVVLLCIGWVEELIFRGVLLRVASDLVGAKSGLVFAALLFGVLHVGSRSVADVCFAIGVGLYFGVVRRYTQSLWGVSVAHGLTNILLFIWLPLSLLPGALPNLRAAENPIQLENARQGTADWTILPARTGHLIEGYASLTSVNLGQEITFYINDVPASPYTIDIFRLGWYGGAGARLMQTVLHREGQPQPACPQDVGTGLVACDWPSSYVLTVPGTWTSGVYLARLTRADGYGQYIIFDVRDDASRSLYLFQNSVTTYEAYNNWGGKSLYGGAGSQARDLTYRAYQVSFDRPYVSTTSGEVARGPYDFFRYEYPMVRWLERAGYDVTYSTDVDTEESGALLRRHKAFLSVGHDEYWSYGMRAHVAEALTSGVGLGFFSGNSMYWQIRFSPSALGPDRIITCYKGAALDPMSHINPAVTTVQWRQQPVNRPENEIMGGMYGGNTALDGQGRPLAYPFVVSNSTSWVYKGTNLKNGTALPGIVGPEYDRMWNNHRTPKGLVVLSRSSVARESFRNGEMYNRADVAEATVYRAPSGATVFDAGTIYWPHGLDNYLWTVKGQPASGYWTMNGRVQTITANVLARLTRRARASAGG